MIKKQQKWIALFVVLTFIWLLQVSTMPAAAASSTAMITSASTEPGPSFIEEPGGNPARGKKKSVLPWILIGVGVLIVTAVILFLVVLKSYDITGSWKLDYTNAPPINTFNITFSGTKTSGTWVLAGYSDRGTYTVDGKNVTIAFNGAPWTFTGKFDGKDRMTGTHTWPALGISGTWTATRLGAASSVAPDLQVVEREGSLVEKLRNR